jgi:hypothetical protein
LRSGSFLREELPSAACGGGGAGEGGSSHLPGAAQAEGEGGGATAAEVEGVGWTEEGRRPFAWVTRIVLVQRWPVVSFLFLDDLLVATCGLRSSGRSRRAVACECGAGSAASPVSQVDWFCHRFREILSLYLYCPAKISWAFYMNVRFYFCRFCNRRLYNR